MKVLLLGVLIVGVAQAANPNYSYHIKIEDAAHANFQEKAETRKGPDAHGFYSVVEPSGALRTVQYTADDRGFNPLVTYSYGNTHVFHQYAPAYVQDKRVQIVDKLTGVAPAINVQPFALPQPTALLAQGQPQVQVPFSPVAPLVVPAPLRTPPPPQLIAQAQGVEYAPAYMPPVTAFVQQALPPQAITYLPPPPPPQQIFVEKPAVVNTYLPPPPPPQPIPVQPAIQLETPINTYLPPPPPQQEVTYLPPPPQPTPVIKIEEPVRTYLPPPPQPTPQPPRAYLPPPPQPPRAYLPPPSQPPRAYLPPPSQPPRAYLPPPRKESVQVLSVQKVPVTVVTEDSYSRPPQNTVTDPNGPTYPDAIPPQPPKSTYGPPNHTPGQPLASLEQKPVKVQVTFAAEQPVAIAKPVTLVQPPPPTPVKVIEQPQPVVNLVQKTTPPLYVQQQVTHHYAPQQQYVQVQQPALVAQKVVQPVVALQQQVHKPAVVLGAGLYAGAVGYHTVNSAHNAYTHSYGTQGFQVTSSRQFNKLQYHQPQVAVKQVVQPQLAVQHVQHVQPIAVAQPQVAVQHHVQHVQPVVQQVAIAQPQVAIAQPQIAVAQPVASYAPAFGSVTTAVHGTPAFAATKLSPATPVAVAGGKKQNPLTFSYSYDQGGAKVSHSYAGSGW